MNLKLVTFDAGDTLIHAHPSRDEIYVEVSRAFGADVPAEEFRRVFPGAYHSEAARPAADRELWERVTRKIYADISGLRGIPFDPWFERLWERFGSAEVWRPFDDVERALTGLRQRGLKLGLISNWDARLPNILRGLGLLDRLSIVKVSAIAGTRKPDPLMFLQAMEEARVRPEEALHVGDLPTEDIEGARKAGWHAVLIDRSGKHAAADGYRVIRSLSEILGLVR